MRIATFLAIVIAAAVVGINSGLVPLMPAQLLATIILVMAVLTQRIHRVNRWLSAPRDQRESMVKVLAEQVLIELSQDPELLGEIPQLHVHVWEVPLWYRRLLPYGVRRSVK